ncbi:lysyl oxidase family protein [Corallococcus sp. BB11-1]|uniref:lysyl oxidase family protein n=1 Tax=Corallococcus sp. BB11-1 TaxID=2996783 RepID=UPI00226DBB26|nr:lysyl oxidase family protein [Corallococcus sp. BB11-1]MCY1029869.1 lysyl oxidase family protein [Corallococcus sp. BB11-1]
MRIHGVLACAVMLSLVTGCKDDPAPRPDAGTPDAGSPDAGVEDAGSPDGGGTAGPTLSETPRWEVAGDGLNPKECFGRSVALGDLNGDGRTDLLVPYPVCKSLATDPGRVAVYAGEARYFSKVPVITTMTWEHPSPRTSGYRLVAATGDIDGDAYADVVLQGYYGVSVFKGGPDLARVLAQPVFRVPADSATRFTSARLLDLDGDGKDDLVVTTATGGTTLYRSTPDVAERPFTNVRVFSGHVTPAGDTDGDGAQDLLVTLLEGQNAVGLFLGCKADSARVCDGPLTVAPVWKGSAETLQALGDLNGDGRPELLVSLRGSQRLHLSDAALQGYSPTAAWQMMDDAAFPLLGQNALSVGDMVEGGTGHDFVISALGRAYLFRPTANVSGPLEPVWAWPRANHLDPRTALGFVPPILAGAGDLDGDGHDDLVVGLTPEADGTRFPGRVVVFGGGAVPDSTGPAPALAPTKTCNLPVDPVNGKPDLTVDRDVLARTLYVERRTFAQDSCEVREGCVPQGGERRLLRFSTSIMNMGSAPVVVPSPQERPDLFVYDECHGHDHLVNFAGYALRDASGKDATVGRKQGFYLIDFTQYCADGSAFAWFDPGTGISPGWSDVYTADTACQWLDVTDTPDGEYTVRVGVDENHIIDEEDTLPNEVTVKVRLSGDTVTVLP